MRTFLVLTILVKLAWSQIGDLEQNHHETSLLSRKRRFSVPSSTGWTFATTLEFVVTIPLEGLDSSAEIKVPFSYTLDLTR